MTAINVKQAADIESMLESVGIRLKKLCSQTKETDRLLNGYSGMAELRVALNSCIEDIEEEELALQEMSKVLSECLLVYTIQEEKILTYEEETENRDFVLGTGELEIPEWTEIILTGR